MGGWKMINKLVRDKIPEIIKSSGKNPIYESIKDEERYIKLLKLKLQEEVTEYIESNQTVELCDVVEVVYALLKIQGISQTQFENMRNEKASSNGKFEDKVFLKDIESV